MKSVYIILCCYSIDYLGDDISIEAIRYNKEEAERLLDELINKCGYSRHIHYYIEE
jgi:hypothetical protein